MIEARKFVEAARERGFHWYAGVPCSFLTPFINYVLQDPSLHYVSMANEGDAVALIAGIAIAGDAGAPHRRGITMMQNSGLGNAVSHVAAPRGPGRKTVPRRCLAPGGRADADRVHRAIGIDRILRPRIVCNR